MAVAFEEIRNLALGVAARGVQWPTLGPAGGIRVSLARSQTSSPLSTVLACSPLVSEQLL